MHRSKHDFFLSCFGRRELFDDASLTRHENTVRQVYDLGQIGGNHHDGEAFIGEALDKVVNFSDGADIGAARWLVVNGGAKMCRMAA